MGSVYALQQGEEDKIKIGCVRSDRPEADKRRRKSHSTSNPSRLTQIDRIETPYPHPCEKFIKDRFQSRKIIDGEGDEWFAVAPAEVHAAFDLARQYFTEYAAEVPEIKRLRKVESDAEPKEPGNQDMDIYWQIKALCEQGAKINYEVERLERKLMISIGTAAGLTGIATWKSKFVRRLNQSALRKAHPALCEEFTRRELDRPFKLR